MRLVRRKGKKDGLEKQYYSTLEEKIGVLLIYWSVIMPILTSISFVPSSIKYAADVLWVGLMLCSIVKGQIAIRRNVWPLAVLVAVFLVYLMATYLVHFQSLLYFVWGFRNLFRYYIAFFAYANTMNERNAEKWFKFVENIFWVNIVVSIFQFVYLGVRQDYLGGVFGIGGGTNGYTTALLSIVVVRSLILAFEKKESLWKCSIVCVAALLDAAMAELKFFFVLFILVLMIAAGITKFSFKKVVLLLGGILIAAIGSQVLVYWFGFDGFFSIDGVIEQATRSSYSNSTAGDINRLSAISTLNRLILESPFERLFGLGLGNCDTSSFAIFNTPFNIRYSHLHYTWFTAPMVYLETGYIGLMIYFMFFVTCFWLSFKAYLQRRGNRLYCQMAMVMSVICCILVFYNASLRYEAAYTIYFVLALPFIGQDRQVKKCHRTEVEVGP